MQVSQADTPQAKPRIFLSCAEEDEGIGGEIETHLRTAKFEVFYWKQPRQRGGLFVEQIVGAINAADIFLVVLSPSYRKSYWCDHECTLAFQREARIREFYPDATMIHVVRVAAMTPEEAGFLSAYDWVDMTAPEKKPQAFADLLELRSVLQLVSSTSGPDPVRLPALPTIPVPEQQVEPMASTPGTEVAFRNRDDELIRVLNGLTNMAGDHFWRVVAPPQLGKTWLLEHIGGHRTLAVPVRWVVRRVDLRSQHGDVPDAATLLGLLFDHQLTNGTSLDLMGIAQKIGASKSPHLCLLDSAELLPEETADTLRGYLSKICIHLEEIGYSNHHLAFIVASRRDDGWKGVIPLRLSSMQLTEFKINVVQHALHDLASEMERNFSQGRLKQNAKLVHSVTEGLPALLVKCLQWIRREEWARPERLADAERFQELVVPYVERELLTSVSLLPHGHREMQKARSTLIQVYRVLAPYRLFTRSHLRHHLDTNQDFSEAVGSVSWTMPDLWQAIDDTALLRRGRNEPWQEIHPAIRRLLFRYFYRSDEERAAAHDQAQRFVRTWSDQQVGRDQVVGLVECLWHEASALALRHSPGMEQRLPNLTRKLSTDLQASAAFTLEELRAYAADRVAGDAELEEVVGNGDGLLRRLMSIVLDPEGH
jgi:hypothetical protein